MPRSTPQKNQVTENSNLTKKPTNYHHFPNNFKCLLEEGRSISVRNLDDGTTEEQLIDHFSKFEVAASDPRWKKEQAEVGSPKSESKCIEARRKTHINDLPDEMLTTVFGYLNHRQTIGIERVCKRWRYVCMAFCWNIPCLRKSSDFNEDLNDQQLECILKRCGPSLTSFVPWFPCRRLTPAHLDIIAENCPNLQKMSFSFVQITNDRVKNFFEICGKLKKIRITGHTPRDMLKSLLSYCNTVDSLELHGFEDLRADHASRVSRSIKSLGLIRSCFNLDFLLQFRNCFSIEEFALIHCACVNVSLSLVLDLFAKSLKKLCLSDNWPFIEFPVSSNWMEKLTALSCSDSTWTNEESFIRFLAKCPHLQTVNISDGFFFGKVSGMLTERSFRAMANCVELTELHISNLDFEEDAFKALAKLSGLQRLKMKRCRTLSDEICIMIVWQCKELSFLDIRGCPNVTEKFVLSMMGVKRKHRLTVMANGTSIPEAVDAPEFVVNLDTVLFSSSVDFLST